MAHQDQLEFDFKNQTPEATFDQEVAVRQQAQKIRTYVYSCANGHRKWADTIKPTTKELLDYQDYLQANPQDTGHHYRDELQRLIRERVSKVVVDTQSLRQVMEEEEKRAGVHVTCLRRF